MTKQTTWPVARIAEYSMQLLVPQMRNAGAFESLSMLWSFHFMLPKLSTTSDPSFLLESCKVGLTHACVVFRSHTTHRFAGIQIQRDVGRRSNIGIGSNFVFHLPSSWLTYFSDLDSFERILNSFHRFWIR